jgi:hypothetical protein
MGASVRTACVVIALLALACCGLPLSGQTPNPVPLINTPLVPISVAPGGAGFTLTLNGTGFVSGATINWNGTALTTTVVSGSQLTATVPAGNIATAGSAWVTVTNPAPGGGTSLPAFLHIATPVASPSFVSYVMATEFSAQGIYPLLTGDFNGDGKLDLAFLADVGATLVLNNSHSVCIALGNGDGSFQQPVCLALRQPASGQFQSPGDLVGGDFNGDGKLDLAVTNYNDGTNSVSVFLGNGDGTLQSPVNSAAGDAPFLLATGDFNRDGKLDLAVLNEPLSGNTQFVSVLLGNGDGTFQSPTAYDTGTNNLYSFMVGDFNGDGNLDLVISNSSPGGVSFLAGNGDGSFQPPVVAQSTDADSFLSVGADFNGDGLLDLLLADQTLPGVSILLGNGNGTFQSATSYALGTQSGDMCPLAADDINADGKLDLALCRGETDVISTVGFQLGNGDGTFQSFRALNVPTGPLPTDVVTGDFNNDGRVDMAVVLYDNSGPPYAASSWCICRGHFPL